MTPSRTDGESEIETRMATFPVPHGRAAAVIWHREVRE